MGAQPNGGPFYRKDGFAAGGSEQNPTTFIDSNGNIKVGGVMNVTGTQAFTGPSTMAGSLTFTAAASGPILKQGANGRVGTFTANGSTPVDVTNTSVAISDAIVISLNTVGGTVGVQPHVATITAGVGFSVVCTASDTSVYNYALVKNAA